MPIDVLGYENERVILSRAYGEVTLEDLQNASNVWGEMLDKAEFGPIHNLVDVSGIEKYPTSVFQLTNTQSYLKHPRLGWVLAYGMKSVAVNFLVTILTQVLRAHVRVFESRTEAIAYLRKIDNSLPGLTD